MIFSSLYLYPEVQEASLPLCMASHQYQEIIIPEKSSQSMTLRNWYENVSVPSPLMWDNAEVYFILFPIKAQFPISGGGLNTALFFGCLSFPVSLSVWTQIFLGPPTLEFLPEVFIPAFLRISTSGRDSKMGSLVGWLAKRRPLLVEVQW